MGVTALITVECDECGKSVSDAEMIQYPMYGNEALFGWCTDDGYELEGWWIEGDMIVSAYCPECKLLNGYEESDQEVVE